MAANKNKGSSEPSHYSASTECENDQCMETTQHVAQHRVLNAEGRLDSPRVVRLGPGRRLTHFLTVLPITTPTGVPPNVSNTLIDFRVYNEASAWLAFTHLNNPALHILPGLRQRLAKCDFRFTLDMRDSGISPIHAAREVYNIFSASGNDASNSTSNATTYDLLPIGMVGAAQSAISISVSLLNLVYRMTQISSSSTSSSLDNKVINPYFARTIPTNAGDAHAVALYLRSLGVTHVGVLYYTDDYSDQYHQLFLNEAAQHNIQVLSVLYNDGGDEAAIQQLARSGLRYFLGIFDSSAWRQIVALAARYNIMGPAGYTWLLSDSSSEIVSPSFQLNRTNQADIATALNGVGVITLYVDNYEPFDALLQQLQRNTTLQDLYIRQHYDPSVFDGYIFPPTAMSIVQYLTYDAMMALGIAACEVPQDLFSGVDLYQQLLRTTFVGTSGFVAFNNDTGTRQSDFFRYQITNVLLSDNLSSADSIRFSVPAAIRVDQTNTSDPVQVLIPFVFSDNTSNVPLPLPPLTVNMNLIPAGARAVGLSVGGLVMMTSLAWLAWTFVERKQDMVRASQPFFLYQLCIGTFLMASSVVWMSLQEPTSQRVLDVACMATPWFLSIGFVTAFAALLAKTWRLNRLFQSGHAFRRVQIRPRDVMLPFFVLMALNIVLLTLWTALAPLHWVRKPVNDFDKFGRSMSSYGSCRGNGSTLVTVLAILLFLVDFSALVFANYQAYLARKLPTDFNESLYIALSMAFLLELALLGLPLVFLATADPTTSFIIRSLLASVSSLTIQLPIFVPKFFQRYYGRKKKVTVRQGWCRRLMKFAGPPR